MKKNPSLGDIYGDILRNVKVVKENAQENINKSKKIPKMSNNAFTDTNSLTKGGPEVADGYHKALNDDYCGCDEDNEEQHDNRHKNKYARIGELEEQLKDSSISDDKKSKIQNTISNLKKDLQREESEEDFIKESKKITTNRLNTFMMKKSTFDKLFESVMGGDFGQDEEAQDVDALGLGDAPTDDEFGDDEFGDEGDQITVTLDRAVARQLCDMLQAAMGDEMGDEMGDDMGDEDDGLDFGDDMGDEDMEEEDAYGEEDNEEPTNAKDGKSGLQGKNNKVNGRPQPKGATTKVVGTTDKVGNDGDHGHAIHSGKQPNMGKQNKVSDLRQAEDFFR
jgi:hypothetical protein